jgi:hypothetical protein
MCSIASTNGSRVAFGVESRRARDIVVAPNGNHDRSSWRKCTETPVLHRARERVRSRDPRTKIREQHAESWSNVVCPQGNSGSTRSFFAHPFAQRSSSVMKPHQPSALDLLVEAAEGLYDIFVIGTDAPDDSGPDADATNLRHDLEQIGGDFWHVMSQIESGSFSE